METKIYYEITDNEGWTSNFYKTKFEESKQKVEELNSESFKDAIYFTINEIEMKIFVDEMYMSRKEIARYWKDKKTWEIIK